jgi:AP-1 complex subunit mu
MIWIIKSLPGGRAECARIKLSFPSIAEERKTFTSPILSVNFEIPYFTISGVQVRYLKVSEKSGYQALPWVRYTTKSGSYNFRI